MVEILDCWLRLLNINFFLSYCDALLINIQNTWKKNILFFGWISPWPPIPCVLSTNLIGVQGLRPPACSGWRGVDKSWTPPTKFQKMAARWPISSHYSGGLLSIGWELANQLTLFRWLTFYWLLGGQSAHTIQVF